MSTTRSILVATDFSEFADRALEAADALAEGLGAEVLLVHSSAGAADPGFGDIPGGGRRPTPRPGGRKSADATAALDARARRLGCARVRTKILTGRVAHAIVDEACRSGVELIVIGTHARGALGGSIRGSIAREVLRDAPCPVLLVGPQGAR